MSDGFAIVGMACRYPDADSPGALWENVLARRRAFRRMPDVRMSLDAYWDGNRSTPDRTYSSRVAVLRDWRFDRERFRIGAAAYAAADTVHWLALEIADAALSDAGLSDVADAQRDRIAVVVGNTLTGDRSRAGVTRLRWPFVARIVDATLRDEGIAYDARRAMLARIESEYKAPFPAVDENSLAGALSNAIAGRICNTFGFGAGGYAVDAACASSLLAVANACSLLEAHRADVVVAGGVDLSLDPFELVGFAKSAALATDEMFVYDRRANGFLPGEGCGLVVLMRDADARASGRRVYATIRGWGISSDGRGGLTRPEVRGQASAIRSAYASAGVSIDSVTSFEGHGTGTPVGDAVEVNALVAELRSHGAAAGGSFLGSVKANIGHTKAAAGVAGLIKATMAVSEGIVPPVTGCDEPLPALSARSPLTVAREPMPWPDLRPRRAGVSAFGFGGINVHVVLDGDAGPRRSVTARESMLSASPQDAELFVLAAADPAALAGRLDAIAALAPQLADCELADVAAALARDAGNEPFRAAIVASTPNELAASARHLLDRIPTAAFVFAERMAYARANREPRVGLLFPGHAAPVVRGAGAWQRRFPSLRFDELWNDRRFDKAASKGGTALAQPAIVAASLCALRFLVRLGVRPSALAGHSLGELTAVCAAGAVSERSAIDLAFARGAAMQPLPPGRMAALACDAATARDWVADAGGSIAAMNAPDQCVVSGTPGQVDEIVAHARRAGVVATLLPVSIAFHSPAMADAAKPLRDAFHDVDRHPFTLDVISTVTGERLPPDADLAELAVTQLTAPVLFRDAVRRLAARSDLLIEAGPGGVLAGITSSFISVPIVAMHACGDSVAGLLSAAGAAFVIGAEIDRDLLFGGRFVRPFDLDRELSFLESPCERGYVGPPECSKIEAPDDAADPETMLREMIAARFELPLDIITPESRLLRDLHLNSITVAGLVGEAATRLGLPPPTAPTQFSDATIAEAARALRELQKSGVAAAQPDPLPIGVADWVRTFTFDRVASSGGHVSRLSEGACPPHIVVSLIGMDAESAFARLLATAREIRDGETFVVVQERAGGSGFARTLHLERPQVNVCVVNVDADDPSIAQHIAAEASQVNGFAEAFYVNGERFVAGLKPALHSPSHPGSLGVKDVLLVTGGGNGIAAESALHLARRTGVAVGIIGRSAVAESEERFRRAGVRVHYERADVTDRAAVADAVARIHDALGAVTAVLHGAGTNVPAPIEQLDERAFRDVFAPKVDGLHNVLAACDGDALRLVLAFGSVIARTGMRGEAHYAFANEWLAAATEEFGVAHPGCRTLTVEWSVWSGVGMGERLGRVEALRREGITPIGVDDAVEILASLVMSAANGSVVVAGRLGAASTLFAAAGELPALRFLEQPRVAVGGVEIVADAFLNDRSDPYLRDHVFRGDRIVPAVIGLEAMAQAASALRDVSLPCTFDRVDLRWPIVVPEHGATLRVAALARDDATEIVLRSSSTRFTVDHVRACLRPHAPDGAAMLAVPESPLALDVDRDVYDALLFHQGRFRRIRSYRVLTATRCIAEIEVRRDPWFDDAPERMILGDPGVRDAAIHALQACHPHASFLPAGVESIDLLLPLPAHGSLFVHANERGRAGDQFVFDVALTDDRGVVFERWRGLRLRVVRAVAAEVPALAPLLWGPYLERRLAELSGVPMQVNVGSASSARNIAHRPDGKPEADDGSFISVAHADGLTLTVSSTRAVACDLAEVVERSDSAWSALLGAAVPCARTIAAQCGEAFAIAATRVWTAHECTAKRRGIAAASLRLADADGRGAVTLSSGSDDIHTFVIADVTGRRLICGCIT